MDEMRDIAATAANVIRKHAMRSPESKRRVLAQLDMQLAHCMLRGHDGCGCKLTKVLVEELSK